jgi:hypothetical protein
MVEVGETAPSILLLIRARNSLHFREPVLTAHLPTPKRLRAGRLVLQRRDSFEAHLPAGRQGGRRERMHFLENRPKVP